MSKSYRGYTDGPFGQIHYQVSGEGDPLILIHQAGCSHIQFLKAYPLLATAGFKAIGVDLPGYGMSDRPEQLPRVEDYAEIIPPLMDHFALERTHILGFHVGAMVATEAVLRNPDRFGKLILDGPLPTTPEERKEIMENAVERERELNKPVSSGAHLKATWDFLTEHAPGWTDVKGISRLVAASIHAGEFCWYAHYAAFTYDHSAALAKLTNPCLILTNNGDIAYSFAVRTKELFPHFDYFELDGGTIDVVDERPEQWTEAVVSFLHN